eukprot:2244818-Pleurochrysis_carterae.AAC.1
MRALGVPAGIARMSLMRAPCVGACMMRALGACGSRAYVLDACTLRACVLHACAWRACGSRAHVLDARARYVRACDDAAS